MKTKPLACSLLTTAILCGCTQAVDLYVPPVDNETSETLKDITEYFDFNTTDEVVISVDYGQQNAQVLLQFFDTCPLVMNEDTQDYSIEGTPLYTIFTDANGQFNGTVKLPTCVKQLYVYSPYWGAPTVVEAQVIDGRVDVKTTGSKHTWQTGTRAVDTPTSKLLKDNFYALVDWNQYGAVTDYNGIYSDGPFSGAFINGIRRALWSGKDTKPTNLDNRKYAAGTSITNTTILTEAEDENGKMQTVESASITLNFLFEAGWFESTLGYYYYKTDACPSDPSQLKKFIIAPNVSIAYNAPYGVKGYNTYDSGLAPMQTNTSVQLLYEDENGQFTTNFPAGYTIGYFMISNGFNSGNGSVNLSGKLHGQGINIFYSNCEWNSYSDKLGSSIRFISAKASDGTLIYGIEDGQDMSYDDAVFTISSSPNFAIQTPGREDMDPIELELTTYPDIQRTYVYEDQWPTGGDYDMNDVVIQHRSEIEMDSQNNVYTVRDYYTAVQPQGSAKNHNAFAIQYGTQLGNTHTFPDGSVWEESTGSLIVFASANRAYGKEYTVTRDFKGFITKSQLNRDENLMNPYIIVNYQPADDSRVEVHLPKQSATSKADLGLIDSADDAYYIDKDGLHPFAICVPGLEYIPANEGILINEHYPKFTDWVSSNGLNNTDWWKYPVE